MKYIANFELIPVSITVPGGYYSSNTKGIILVIKVSLNFLKIIDSFKIDLLESSKRLFFKFSDN